MKPAAIRLPAILALAAAVGTNLLLLLMERLARQSLADSIDDTAALHAAVGRMHGQFVIYGLALMVLAPVAGWLLGRALMKPFERLTTLLAGGGMIAPRSRIGEAYDLELAASRRNADDHVRIAAEETRSAHLAQLVREVSEGLIHIDGNGRVLQANPAAVRMLALPDEIADRNIVTMIRNADVRQVVKAAILGETINAEVVVDQRQLLINAHPIRGGAGVTGGNGATGADVRTERHSAVVTIVDLTKLRRLEGVRRDFVANVSHELKTPLTSIHGYVETLRSDAGIPLATRQQFLEIIDRNALRLQDIIDDLLDLSRIESGAWQPDLGAVDAGDVARDVWASCREMDAARSIRFAAPPPGSVVRADARGLRHALSNVIANAVRYTPAGGEISVTVRDGESEQGTPVSIIDVTDTGTGIPRDAIPRIFERFYRVDPARSREAGGTGLGLAIVKHLVEGMDGSVSASSELGRGTTITITLPAP